MSSALPSSVLQRLSNSDFLHLGTSSHDIPHVSLMNYTFIGPENKYKSSEKQPEHLILLATSKNTEKYQNLVANPRCSILVHDWVTSEKDKTDNILKLLESLNQAEISELSCTLAGHVFKVLEKDGGEEFEYYKEKHLQRNPKAKVFMDTDDLALVLIQIDTSKVVDASNNISRYG
ncbi:DEKNAAC104418 [Brettanomyces naardenensis]|uniref:DEKNAAC104418 n=1 Tax=Brettanomyces naardenensis TaxID=13370 RepID=A0A448YQX1_BRENA|nr:DEKNAAC104418 [Brettanomyces naardenensis]